MTNQSITPSIPHWFHSYHLCHWLVMSEYYKIWDKIIKDKMIENNLKYVLYNQPFGCHLLTISLLFWLSAWCFTCEPCISSTVLCSFKNNRTPSTKTRCKYVSTMIHSIGVAYFPRMPSLGFLLLSQSKETVNMSWIHYISMAY